MSWQEQQLKCKPIERDDEEEYYKRKCHDKVRHQNQAQADRECLRMNMKKRVTCVAYECEFCGYWHIGKSKEPYGKLSKESLVKLREDKTFVVKDLKIK